MIPTKQSHATIEGDLGGKSKAMGFDATAMVHLMGVLTNLYSDPIATVIREYSTNGWDSHILAGKTDVPLRVTTPTAFDSFLRIKDIGLGMDEDDIFDTYANYGASTKRGTNAVAGMLGLGSKSALAYTEMFVVTAVKDGVRRVVHVSRDAQGVGNLNIISEKATDDANGVEVAIPVKAGDHNEFTRKARQFFRFWQPGQVSLNGADPSIVPSFRKIHDKLFVFEEPGYSFYSDPQSFVIMGNVAYPVDNNYAIGRGVRRSQLKTQIAAYVDMGTVEFTPSREALNYTDLTKATLASIDSEYAKHIMDAVQNEINDAATPGDAFTIYKDAERTYGNGVKTDDLTYKGKSFPDFRNGNLYDGKVIFYDHRATRYKNTTYANVPSHYYAGTPFLVVNNFDDTGVNGNQWKKVKYYCEQHSIDIPNHSAIFVLGASWDVTKSIWTKHYHVLDWNTIKAIKVPRNRTASPNTGGGRRAVKDKYSVISTDATPDGYEEVTLDPNKPIYYYMVSDEFRRDCSAGNRKSLLHILDEADAQIVRLEGNRKDKFLRDFPKAKTVKPVIESKAKVFWTGWTDDEIRQYHHQTPGYWGTAKDFKGCKFDDPAITDMYAHWDRIEAADTQAKAATANRLIGISQGFRDFDTRGRVSRLPDIDWDKCFKRYPLLNTSHKQASVDYCNWLYNSKFKP